MTAPRQERPDSRDSGRSPFGAVSRKDAVGLLLVIGAVVLISWLLRTFGGY